jgi:hypothetical protein
MTESGISVTAWSDLRLVSLLLATLESVCCSRSFSNCNLLRCVATSRVTEQKFYSGTFLEGEIFKTVNSILESERIFFPGQYDRFLRWILFSRDLLSGGSTKSENEEKTCDRSGVVAAALSVAATDARSIYEVASPICSSVKCIAAQIAVSALEKLHDISRAQPTNIESRCHFDVSEAINECLIRCTIAADKKVTIPSSMLVLHLEDLLASACMSCIATIDQADVLPLQESSIYFLSKLIECFGPYPDPENLQSSILEQYSTQLFSSIRHALSAADTSIDNSTSRLVLSGCKALSSCVEAKIVTDPAALRRLLRPIVPKDSDMPYFELQDRFPTNSNGNSRTSEESNAHKLIFCAKLWTVGSLLMGNESTIIVSDELIKNKTNVAVHLAAAAIDGARILYGNGLSLDGMPLEAVDCRCQIAVECGYHYSCLADIDDCLKELLTSNWATFASRGLQPLLTELVSNSGTENSRLSVSAWIKSLVVLLFVGTEDCLSKLYDDTSELACCRQSASCSTLMECLDGLAVACRSPHEIFGDSFASGLSSLVDLFHHNLFVPILSQKEVTCKAVESNRTAFDSQVVEKACKLLCIISEMDTKDQGLEASVLLCILKPLEIFQRHPEVVDLPLADEVVAACLRGVGSLIAQSKGNGDLTQAMIGVVVENAAKCQRLNSNVVQEASKILLKACLEHGDIPMKRGHEIGIQLASSKNWDIWSEAAAVSDGLLIIDSLTVLQSIMDNPSETESHCGIQKTILKVLQSATNPTIISGRIFNGVGAGILSLLYLYGTNKIGTGMSNQRSVICADSIKLCILVLQHVVNNNGDSVIELLSVFFQTFLAVIRFNGLPNHPSPELSNDPSLGRVCAQAILHTARTTPDSFKACVALLPDVERTLLEFSVRAEMTGYVVAQQAPVKKKLNLAGFRK